MSKRGRYKPSETRSSLLLRLRDASDTHAWREFEEKYGELILRYAAGRGLQAADAEDVRQIVMLKLARTLPGFQYRPERGRFRAYLGRIVHNVVNEFMAKPSTQPAAALAERLDTLSTSEEPLNDPRWEEEWVLHHYRRAMSVVRASHEPQTVAVFDRLVAGESVERVAASYSMTPQAVYKIKQRLADRIRRLIDAQVREEDGLPIDVPGN